MFMTGLSRHCHRPVIAITHPISDDLRAPGKTVAREGQLLPPVT